MAAAGLRAGSGGQVAKKTVEETSAGGVVFREQAGAVEIALAEQVDRNLERRTVRLPKGHLDAGETTQQAARREVLEETGLEAEIVAPLSSVSYVYEEKRKRRRVRKRVDFYLMRQTAGELRPVDGEFDRTFWCSPDEAESLLTFETERQVVSEARGLLRDLLR